MRNFRIFYLMSAVLYMVSSFRENWVPGISMVQEKTVCSDSSAVARLVFTATSYISPRRSVVVVSAGAAARDQGSVYTEMARRGSG